MTKIELCLIDFTEPLYAHRKRSETTDPKPPEGLGVDSPTKELCQKGCMVRKGIKEPSGGDFPMIFRMLSHKYRIAKTRPDVNWLKGRFSLTILSGTIPSRLLQAKFLFGRNREDERKKREDCGKMTARNREGYQKG